MSGTTQGNPLIALGSLNRLRASIIVPGNTSLNVTAPYLGKEGVSITLEGEAVPYLPVMAGAVPSPEPYQMVRVRVMLLKTQGLAATYKAQYESDALIGGINVKADAATLPTYSFVNCSLVNIPDLAFNGDNPNFPVEIRGYYLINNFLWNPS
jgi:hypothetical protein